MEKIKTKKGFTLIELLIVVAIIGILAVAIFVGLNSARHRAFIAKRKAAITSMQKQIAMCCEKRSNQIGVQMTDVGADIDKQFCYDKDGNEISNFRFPKNGNFEADQSWISAGVYNVDTNAYTLKTGAPGSMMSCSVASAPEVPATAIFLLLGGDAQPCTGTIITTQKVIFSDDCT